MREEVIGRKGGPVKGEMGERKVNRHGEKMELRIM